MANGLVVDNYRRLTAERIVESVLRVRVFR
jgi:hypothetical protein